MPSPRALVGPPSGPAPPTVRGVSVADLSYAHAGDVLGLAGVVLFAAAGWLMLADGMPVLASAVFGRDPAWSKLCAIGFGRGIGLDGAAAAWLQAFALSSAMVVALMVPLAAPWRRLRRNAPRSPGAWASLAAYAGLWLAAEAGVGLVEVGLKALGATVGADLAPPDLLTALLFAAAVQNVQGALLRPPRGTAGRGAAAHESGFRDGLRAGAACVRANLLAMTAMCVAGAVSLPMLAFLAAAMAIDRLAPSAAGGHGGA